MELVLSLFPGADIFGRGFEAEGFSVVKGPDLLWDSKIEDFHVPPGRFDGIIAGPPCQNYSDANRNRKPEEGDRLLRECLRAIDESQPQWFLIENVRNVPTVALDGYHVQRLSLRHDECGGKTTRSRVFQFGSRIDPLAEAPVIIRPSRTKRGRSVTPVLLASKSRSAHDRHGRRCVAAGIHLPLTSLTKTARRRVIGNAVPFEMAQTIAQAVTRRSVVTDDDCVCLCGRVTSGPSLATAACRKRVSRSRLEPTRIVTVPGTVTSMDHAVMAGAAP